MSDAGRQPASHEQQKSSVPRWVVCDAREFEKIWLPKFDSRILPRCTDAEWLKIRKALYGS